MAFGIGISVPPPPPAAGPHAPHPRTLGPLRRLNAAPGVSLRRKTSIIRNTGMRAWWPLLILLLSQGVSMDSTVNSVHRWGAPARWMVVLQESPRTCPAPVAPAAAQASRTGPVALAPITAPAMPLPGVPLLGSVEPRAGPEA